MHVRAYVHARAPPLAAAAGRPAPVPVPVPVPGRARARARARVRVRGLGSLAIDRSVATVLSEPSQLLEFGGREYPSGAL